MRIKTDKSDKEWFCGKDVCRILGFQDIKTTLIRRVKQAYKTNLKSLIPWDNTSPIHDTHKEGKAVYISEPGLYKLVFASRLEKAELFRSWVFEVVLPAIRGAGKLEASLRQELVLKDKRASRRTRQSHACPGYKGYATGCKRWRNTKITGCKRWRKQKTACSQKTKKPANNSERVPDPWIPKHQRRIV